MRPLSKAFLVFSLMFATAAGPAASEHALADVKYKYMLVPDKWACSAVKDKSGEFVDIIVQDTHLTYPLNRFWLADRIGTAKLGNFMKPTGRYLNKLTMEKYRPRFVRVEVVKVKGAEEPFVSGLWAYNPDEEYLKSSTEGDKMLNLTAAEVRALGIRQFLKEVRKHSIETFRQLLLTRTGANRPQKEEAKESEEEKGKIKD